MLRGHTAPGTGLLKLASFILQRLGSGGAIDKQKKLNEKIDINSHLSNNNNFQTPQLDPSILYAAALCRQYKTWRAGVGETVLNNRDGKKREEYAKSLKILQESQATIFSGRSKYHGRPVCWVRPELHPGGEHDINVVMYHYETLFKHGTDLADEERNIGVLANSTESDSTHSTESATKIASDLSFDIIYDRRKLSLSHARRNAHECRLYIGENAHMCQTCIDLFYCRIGSVYVIGAGGWFHGLWGLFSVFLSKEAAGKLRVLKDVRILRDYVHEENMPEPWRSEVYCESERTG